MLVRFLSFTASVLGSARHRAILVSCLAVVFALSSVMGMTLFHKGTPNSGASARGSGSEASAEAPIWLNGQKVDDKDKVATEASKNKEQTPAAPAQTTTEEAEPQEQNSTVPAPEFTLNTENVTLVDGKGDVTAKHTGTNAILTLTAMLGDAETSDISVKAEKSAAGFALRITAAETAAANTPYKVKLHIELTGSDGTVTNLSKIITVTIPAPQQ